MRTALKEWAAICQALAEGRQCVILRRGGLLEPGGEFQPEHQEFLLLPTYLHQSAGQLKPAALDLLESSQRDRPPAETLRLTHWASVVVARPVESEQTLAALSELHLWAESTVLERLHRWRNDRVHALLVRVYALANAVEVANSSDYGGCRSWVELHEGIETAGSTPVIADDVFGSRTARFQRAFAWEKEA